MRLQVRDPARGIGLRDQIPGDQLDGGAVHAAIGIGQVSCDLNAGILLLREWSLRPT